MWVLTIHYHQSKRCNSSELPLQYICSSKNERERELEHSSFFDNKKHIYKCWIFHRQQYLLTGKLPLHFNYSKSPLICAIYVDPPWKHQHVLHCFAIPTWRSWLRQVTRRPRLQWKQWNPKMAHQSLIPVACCGHLKSQSCATCSFCSWHMCLLRLFGGPVWKYDKTVYI